jgi:Subtilisin inhibitor-like
MRLTALLLVGVLVLTAGCLGGSSASPGVTRLTVVVHGINAAKPWHTTWTLRCSPAGGSHPRPRASCSALAKLLAHDAVPPRHCASEMGGPWTTVRGTYRGKPISLDYGEACATGTRTSLEAQALGAYFTHG